MANEPDSGFVELKELSEKEKEKLLHQNSRLVSDFQALKLERDAQKNWDLFYKRNETRFFKDRHWTTREFEILSDNLGRKVVLLEVGCGVGNFFYPLIEEGKDMLVYACDFSPRAISLVKADARYDEEKIKAFQADLTQDELTDQVPVATVDIATMIFVLSAIHPDKFGKALKNVYNTLRPGGSLLFRDYGLYDMAQLRFKPGHKIAENFYMRQDGTRSYYFSLEQLEDLAKASGFEVRTVGYVQRRTVNLKEEVDVPRTFLQAELIRLMSSIFRPAVVETRQLHKPLLSSLEWITVEFYDEILIFRPCGKTFKAVKVDVAHLFSLDEKLLLDLQTLQLKEDQFQNLLEKYQSYCEDLKNISGIGDEGVVHHTYGNIADEDQQCRGDYNLLPKVQGTIFQQFLFFVIKDYKRITMRH
ncbi:hypothetical protein B566_EDAN011734 [Ephemera danica]|nr:hypothetical protein B566_EDAN011734 [Ephemera danica]